MMGISSTVLLLEGGLAVLFLSLLWFSRSKAVARADLLWIVVWGTRLFASLFGSRHMSGDNREFLTYVGLQTCAGLSLMLILARHERSLLREKLMRRVSSM